MFRRLAVLAGGLLLLGTASLVAQDAILGQMYGSGVHAYFTQEYRQAYDFFTSAINGGSVDPRCYYFRGLTYLKLGREEEAKADFEQAAKLETADVNQSFRVGSVGRSLERIQGSERQMLEGYRAQARMMAMQRAENLRKARYEEVQKQEKRVTLQQTEGAPAQGAAPGTPIPPVDEPFKAGPAPSEKAAPEAPKTPVGAAPKAPAPGEENPFDVGPAKETAPKPTAPAPKEPAAAAPKEKVEDPFAEGAKDKPAAEKPAAPKPAATENPFGIDEPAKAKPAAPPAGEKPAPDAGAKKGGGSVFGAMGKALGKAIGDIGEKPGDQAKPAAPAPAPAGTKPAATENPFAPPPAETKPAAPAAGNPFGDAPAEKKPAAPAPAAPAKDLVKEKPAVAPDDPFGAGGEEPKAKASEKPAADLLGLDAADEKPAKKPTAKKPTAKKPAADEGDNAFGADAGAEDKPAKKPKSKKAADEADSPFGADAGADEKPAKKPSSKKAADDGNPFGAGAPADDKGAAGDAAGNPFADEKPAAKKAPKKKADDE